MAKLLEVIVTSLREALEAASGGADRLELVRNLGEGGLTPAIDVAEAVIAAVNIPVRLMVREQDRMVIQDSAELRLLEQSAEAFSRIPASGLVAGFVDNGEVDTSVLKRLSDAAPNLPITFHRAFECLQNPESSLVTLRTCGFVDRILVRVGTQFSIPDLLHLQALANPQIKMIVGIGLTKQHLSELQHADALAEVHVGRAVREPEVTTGKLDPRKVAALKKALA